ncbi:hypothetical protein [Rickettsiella endosymbiont of Aleochara curtula]|uniref:hypothetical protein n=1 Tax=Rickettsiella endosymbiont of Aleochara curtula TaxID=3077936 RepID=UPI00313E7858
MTINIFALAMPKTNYPSWRTHEVSVAIHGLACYGLAVTSIFCGARNDEIFLLRYSQNYFLLEKLIGKNNAK